MFGRIERATAAASHYNSAGAMRASGIACYDGGFGTVMWIHE